MRGHLNTATAEHAIAAYKRSYPSLFGLIIEADLSPIFWFSISNSFVVYLRHNRDGTHTHTYLQVNNKLSRQNTKHEITLPARRHLLRCSFHHLWVFRTLCRSSELKHQTEQNRNRKPKKKKKKIEWYNDEGDRVSLADQLVSWQRVVRPKSRTSTVRVWVRRDFSFWS